MSPSFTAATLYGGGTCGDGNRASSTPPLTPVSMMCSDSDAKPQVYVIDRYRYQYEHEYNTAWVCICACGSGTTPCNVRPYRCEYGPYCLRHVMYARTDMNTVRFAFELVLVRVLVL
eukprot:scaffold47403_cov21-Prasinocladus_malaysianus.AAC.1